MKRCIDCAWCINEEGYKLLYCMVIRKKNAFEGFELSSRDMIENLPLNAQFFSCNVHRTYNWVEARIFNRCGKGGRWFELKLTR